MARLSSHLGQLLRQRVDTRTRSIRELNGRRRKFREDPRI